jgi:hypothetical protein
MLAPPRLDVPDVELDMSRLSIYAGQQGGLREFQARVPAVISSAWQADDGDVAIVLVNISGNPRELSLAPNRCDLRLLLSGPVYRLSDTARESLMRSKDERETLSIELAAGAAVVIEFTK